MSYWLVSSGSTLTADLFGLSTSLLSSGFFPAFSGRWRGEPSDLEEAKGGGGDKVSMLENVGIKSTRLTNVVSDFTYMLLHTLAQLFFEVIFLVVCFVHLLHVSNC